jgi:uncharacterized glyoxalase superfamily protein PhnB
VAGGFRVSVSARHFFYFGFDVPETRSVCDRDGFAEQHIARRDAGSLRDTIVQPNARYEEWSSAAMIEGVSAVTLATHNMARAVAFYRMLGFEVIHGGDDAAFTSFRAGSSFLNLVAQPAERKWSWWGRVIFYHSDVDSLYASVIAAGYRPDTAPRDAEWGERFFHLTDPDGHELSFAWPLRQ